MTERDDGEQVYLAALAGLLHDIGKFAQRAGWDQGTRASISARLVDDGPLAHLVPESWRSDVCAALSHQVTEDEHSIVRAVRVAGWLATGQEITEARTQRLPRETPLVPVTARIGLEGAPSASSWGYPLDSVTEGAVLFPSENPVATAEVYARLWRERFLPAVEAFPGPVASYARMAGLLDLLAAHTSYIPASAPWQGDDEARTVPDLPLYDHLHLSAAVAACLVQLPPADLAALHAAGRALMEQSTEVARLLKIDLSGIQAFIYRITEPADQEGYRHTAKRLRGRSLHLTLLTRGVGDWLLRSLKLPPTNLLYDGGGVLELLLPPDVETRGAMDNALGQLEDAMWSVFHGDLGAVWADQPLTPGDFGNVSEARGALEQTLARAKDRKWHSRLGDPAFFQADPIYHTCTVCRLTPVSDEGQICESCKMHKAIGERLPYAAALAHTQQRPPADVGVTVGLPEPLDGFVTLVEKVQQNAMLSWAERTGSAVLLEGVNQFPSKAGAWPDEAAPGRWEVANAAPAVGGQVYDFERMAELSEGASLLGILRADVDRAGLFFSHGLHPPTFSRSTALSSTLSRFFGPYVNDLAYTLTEEWRDGLDEERQRGLEARGLAIADLESLFYVLYAGGDDLFVVGPWDQTVKFALRLAERFRTYTCGNMTLSAGLVLVKPRFPVQQFTRLAAEAEHAAKEAGRERIHLFGRSLTWERAEHLIEVAHNWLELGIPRTLIHDLGRTGRSYRQSGDPDKPLFTPRLYYTIVRRLRDWDKKAYEAFAKEVLEVLPDITVPVSYASLITRKE